jgi:hypothetical protein
MLPLTGAAESSAIGRNSHFRAERSLLPSGVGRAAADEGRWYPVSIYPEDISTREFVVNVVPESLAEAMNVTATEYPHGTSEFEKAGLTPMPSERVNAPRLRESPIHFECELHDKLHVGVDDVGGGTIVVGRIVLIHVDESVLKDGKIDYELYHPVARLGGMEYSRTPNSDTSATP